MGQFTTDEITYVDRIDLKNSNSWAVGAGINNFIMHGDLRSLNTNNLGNFYNFGGYAYINKMFNPLLGLEFKASYTQISGGSQYLSNIYKILYLPDIDSDQYGYQVNRNGTTETITTDNLLFRGRSYGGELNLIFSFSNLYETTASKWYAAGYFGAGFHQYNSSLREKLSDGSEYIFPSTNFGSNPKRDNNNEASSIYLSGQLGLKRRINKHVDLEVRTGIYFNYEDHLDAMISNKQDWETFFVTSIGVAVKLGKKKVFTIWNNNNNDNNFDKFKIVDSDNDGVIDQLDIEPNTPKGVMVYGNGSSVVSEKSNHLSDKNKIAIDNGLPAINSDLENKDTDGDSILDEQDLCPEIIGTLSNKGCPDTKNLGFINEKISLLATSIYFDTNSDQIKPISFSSLDEIAILMNKVPTFKFIIEGHTDNVSSDKDNLYLSQRRAASVKKYLLKATILSDRLISIGYGKYRPAYSNDTPGGRQLNRRVEITPVTSID
jgi:outer membrane protein OmpA-like peptidoglycan-associated protein